MRKQVRRGFFARDGLPKRPGAWAVALSPTISKCDLLPIRPGPLQTQGGAMTQRMR